MRTFILVYFWILVVSIFIRVMRMTISNWPLNETRSLGQYVGETLIILAFTIWAAIVLWVYKGAS